MVHHAHKVSQKGQIVVPAKYRKRLSIKPEDRMNFRIQGNILIVEKAQDTAADIEYLKGKEGLFGEEFLSREDIEDVVRDLLMQQFYKGDNVITDRVGNTSIRIRGSQVIIDEVISVLTHSAEPWLQGDYTQNLRNFAEDLELDFPSLLAEFAIKMKNMEMLLPPNDRDTASILVALAIGETLSEFRTRVGDIVTEKLIKEATVVKEFMKAESDFVGKHITPNDLEDIITDELAQNFSILMNLKVLKELAKVSIKSVGERKFKEYSNILFENIFKGKEYQNEREDQPDLPDMPGLPDFNTFDSQ
jgi:AbrB family looped-hinge helix DNA binding protein